MSNAKAGSAGTPPRAWQTFELQPEQIGLHGPFFKEGAQVTYPDFQFDVNLARLSEGNGVIDTTPATRLRYCLNTIAETVGDDFPELGYLGEPKARKLEQKNFHEYTSGQITVNGTKIPRAQFLDHKAALLTFYSELKAANHPSWQFVNQLNEIGSESLRATSLEEIREGIAAVTNWPRLKEIYEEQTKAYRERYKLSSGFAGLLGLIIRN